MVVASDDPGIPNWLDNMGRTSGTIYWRFMLPEEGIVTPKTRVVALADLRGTQG
jgi:hypothetical protein